MSLSPVLTAERIDPILMHAGSEYDQRAMQLHIERYEFASQHVVERRVVDCACGTGYGSELLACAGASAVWGVDNDGPSITYAQAHHAHGRVTYQCADALSYEPACVPQVWVSLETVEHLADPLAYLHATHRRLDTDGLLIASVPTTVSTDGNPFHRTDFTRRSWRRLLATAGFEILDELRQEHAFTLGQIVGSGRGERQRHSRQHLLRYYVMHPHVAWARLALTVSRGFVHEYLTVVARRAGGKVA